MLPNLNHVEQFDFLYISELDNKPILHLVHLSTSFSATALFPSREHEDISKAIETVWANVHGPPHALKYDHEFSSTKL